MAERSTEHGILAGLNEAQERAAKHGDGPLLIIAGAGTGKTRTLVHRVAHLLDRGVDPGRLMLVTFAERPPKCFAASRPVAATRRRPSSAASAACQQAVLGRHLPFHRHAAVEERIR